jgi:iron complex outermembrane receptor protein
MLVQDRRESVSRLSRSWRRVTEVALLVLAVLSSVPAGAVNAHTADESAESPQQAAEQTMSTSGTVVDSSGGAVLGATVTLTDDAGVTRGRTVTDASGAYTITSVRPGSYLLRVEHAAFETERVQVTLNAGTTPLRVVLKVAGVQEFVTVEGAGYRAPSAGAATRTGGTALETPVAVAVVPRAVIADQRSTRLKDSVENVASVRPIPSLQSGNGYLIRGFADARRILVNGLAASFLGFRSEFDAGMLEQVEVLKGPGSVLYGRLEPGGAINLVTKRPLAARAFSVEQEVGSFNTLRTAVDGTGPLTANGSILYRAMAVFQKADTFRDFGKSDRTSVTGALTWRPRAGTELIVEGGGVRQNYIADFGVPVVGDRPAALPIERSFGDPNDPEDSLSRANLGWELSQRVSGTWQLRHRFLFGDNDSDDDFINPAPAFGNALRADGQTLDRNIFYQESHARIYTTNAELVATIPVGPTRHHALAGVDVNNTSGEYRTFGNFTTPNPLLAINIYNPSPSYGLDPALFLRERDVPTSPLNYSEFIDENRGIYFEDRMSLGRKFHALAGGRYDWARVARGRGVDAASAEHAVENSVPSIIRRDEKFTGRLGLLAQPVPALALYGSWSTSFGANNGITAAGIAHPPQEGEQFEVGAKGNLGASAFATVSVFRLARQNLLTPDLSTPDPSDSIAIGESRSRGLELDVTGRVVGSLDVLASYAYTDAEVWRDNAGLQGKRLSNVPAHAGSVWLRYQFEGRPLTVGGGLFAVGERQGDASNTFLLEGYGRVDVMGAYRWRITGSTLHAQLNVRNVLNTTYFESTDQFSNVAPRLGVYPGAPRAVTLTVRVEF